MFRRIPRLRRQSLVVGVSLALVGGVSATAAGAPAAPGTTTSFTLADHGGPYTPNLPYEVGVDVCSVVVEATGASGGEHPGDILFGFGPYAGGLGATVSATLDVTPGETLYVNVGGAASAPTGGANGGGSASDNGGRGGGGASDLRRGGTALANRVVVAAGGGGAALDGAGGNAGHPQGAVGAPVSFAGEGGTQSAGGAAGGFAAQDGALGIGGDAHVSGGGAGTGGGGGGGYYGGGGGAGFDGGGGGSSYADAAATDVAHGLAGSASDGNVSITAIACPPSPPAPPPAPAPSQPPAESIDPPGAPSLAFAMRAPARSKKGRIVGIKMVVANRGNAAAETVRVRLRLAPKARLWRHATKKASNRRYVQRRRSVTWMIGPLAPGEKKMVLVRTEFRGRAPSTILTRGQSWATGTSTISRTRRTAIRR